MENKIREIGKGEIVIIENREYVLTSSAIGGTSKQRPILILLENFITDTPRKLRGCPKRTQNKKFKTIKWKRKLQENV